MSDAQPATLARVRELLPDWEQVDHGESGTVVMRSADGRAFAQCVPATQSASLATERDRTDWLHREGSPHRG